MTDNPGSAPGGRTGYREPATGGSPGRLGAGAGGKEGRATPGALPGPGPLRPGGSAGGSSGMKGRTGSGAGGWADPPRPGAGGMTGPAGAVASGLREARLRLGLSQQELAARAGVTRQAIGAVEAGQMTPSLAVAIRLARALGCRVEDLFWLDEPVPEVVVDLPPDPADQEPAPAQAAVPSGGPPGVTAEGRGWAGARILVARVNGRWVGHLLRGEDAFAAELVPAGARLVAPVRANGATPAPGTGGAGEPGEPSTPAAAGHRAGKGARGDRGGATGCRWRAALLEPPDDLARRVLIAGCAPELSLWARALAAGRRGVHLHRLVVNSRRALELLRAGTVHAAGVHLAGTAGQPDNLPFVRAMLEGLEAVVIRLGVWEEGLVVAPGNPLGLQGVGDLARPGVVVVNREPGAGSRLLLERCLAEAGIPASAVAGFDRQVGDHLAVARAVARGEAHAGVSTAAVATAFGLGFVPLRSVAYDLVFLRSTLDEPAVQALLGSLGDAWVRRQLAALGGFDTTATGTVTARPVATP